ncbi:MAG: hypothetical protein ACJ78Q_14275 [Chloroflexia bacterium]
MRHETHTHLKRDEIFAAAKRFFGEEDGGLGMKLGAEQGAQIHFFGNGLVWITVWPAKANQKEIRVDLDVSDRDGEARAFIDKLLKPG